MGVRTLVGRVALAGFAICHIQASTMHAAQYSLRRAETTLAAGSAAAPWKTLQHAAEQVGPGDRVTVRPGNYAGFPSETSGTRPRRSSSSPSRACSSISRIRFGRTTASILKMPRTSSSTASRSPACRGPASARSASTATNLRPRHHPQRPRLQQRQVGHLHRLRQRPADREQRDVRLGDRARHLRLQQRRPARHSQQHLLGQQRATAST